MRRTTARRAVQWALPALVAISGCSTPKLAKLEIPDGRHRRPANPYGTVLPRVDAVVGTVSPPTQAAIAIPTAATEPTMVFPMHQPTASAPTEKGQVPALETAPAANAKTEPMEK